MLSLAPGCKRSPSLWSAVGSESKYISDNEHMAEEPGHLMVGRKGGHTDTDTQRERTNTPFGDQLQELFLAAVSHVLTFISTMSRHCPQLRIRRQRPNFWDTFKMQISLSQEVVELVVVLLCHWYRAPLFLSVTAWVVMVSPFRSPFS